MESDEFPLKEKLIGISISDSADMKAKGFGVEHLRTEMVTIARRLLRLGADLGYGGDLRLDGYTRVLFDLVRSEHFKETGADQEKDWTQRLANYMAWPIYTELSTDDEARLLNICRFIKVTPEDAGFPRDDKDVDDDYKFARCLSAMRELMQYGSTENSIPSLHARVVMGGGLDGFKGFMAGIVEEALYALEGKTALYVVGAFGGAAGALGESLLGEKTRPELAYDRQKKRISNWKQFIARDKKNDPPEKLFDRLEKRLVEARNQKDLGITLRNGLSNDENRELIETDNLKRVTHLIEKGLKNRP